MRRKSNLDLVFFFFGFRSRLRLKMFLSSFEIRIGDVIWEDIDLMRKFG